MRISTHPIIWCLLLLLSGCVDSYAPEVIQSANNYLVVDGFINGNGSTTIRLSRSINIAEKNTYPPEINASVAIENKNGLRYSLQEDSAGVYTSPQQVLPVDQYRLHIRTSTGREYASDYVLLKQTPPIDNLEGRAQADGLQIYISAHDETRQTQYYRWEYTETWAFTSAYWSRWRFGKGNSERRTYFRRTEDIHHCWRTEASALINTANTLRLSQDAVRDYRLKLIPSSSGRLQSLYSILVRQYAMSAAEFDYWEAIKKNTENIGTLFDPLPSQIQGNVHCLTDDTEPVLGFVGAATVVEQRLFVDRLTLPNEWHPQNEGYERCTGLNTLLHDSTERHGYNMYKFFADTTYRVPVTEIRDSRGTIIGFENQTPDCIDCRLRGSNVKPSFWP
ncbi:MULTISPECIES: DUF4249 domain-containing protein [Hymenobacter]|uniref:DUF4249 domain-containing protein n=1 Tax=Hymenobacter mucosus TaxID=1411120 RepID=A0A238YYS2_9BACT|nr:MULTISPECIES: DUF4249 domain-containing protein [Hymenobacter]SNR75824.1 protein of unknown function [Hymenobacter mucosus]